MRGELLPGSANAGLRRVAVVLFALGIVVSVASLQQTWRQPILESNSFRQTQTALSAFWIAQGGPILAYETPVVGAPWAIPFEFPLYQTVVAAVHAVTRLHLDGAGRLVSWLFFLLTLWQVHVLVRRLGGDRYLGLLVCALLLLSPLYVFWSRTFMMESAALFFAVAFTSKAIDHVQRPRVTSALAMTVLAILAALVKVTTFVAFGAAAGLYVVRDIVASGAWRDRTRWLRNYAPVGVAGLVAIVMTALWVRHCDGLKSQNLFGQNLVSANLEAWNYGTLAQRLDPALWRGTIFGRTLVQSLGAVLVLGAALGSAIAFGRRAVAWLVTLVALYVLPFMVFTNVHWVHHYYQYANALFVVVGVGFVAWHSRDGWRRWLAYGLIALTVACQSVQLVSVEWPQMTADQSRGNTIQLRRWLRRLPADGVVIVFGYDWSSEVAYYSKHRAITVPLWASRKQLESLRMNLPTHTDGRPIVAVVKCGDVAAEIAPLVDALIAEQTRERTRIEVGTCVVWR